MNEQFNVGDKAKLVRGIEQNEIMVKIAGEKQEFVVLTPDNYGFVRVETARGYKGVYNFEPERIVKV